MQSSRCCLHQNNLRARTRKLVFGVRRLLATDCVMHRVYRSRHFVSLRYLFIFFTMQSSPYCLLFRQQKKQVILKTPQRFNYNPKSSFFLALNSSVVIMPSSNNFFNFTISSATEIVDCDFCISDELDTR